MMRRILRKTQTTPLKLLLILLVCMSLSGCAAAGRGGKTLAQSLQLEPAAPSDIIEKPQIVRPDFLSLDRDYEWYIDQTTTGEAYASNCMPSCAVMAAKWYDAAFSKTVAEVRADNPSSAEGWSNIDAFAFFLEHAIPCEIGVDISESILKKHLDRGEIVLVSLDTSAISYLPDNPDRLGKPFDSSFAHTILVKGYRTIDEMLYFEVYDPDSVGVLLADGSFIGKNRYYRASEVIAGALLHGYGYIAVQSTQQSSRTASPS